jgi:hypothetical protein
VFRLEKNQKDAHGTFQIYWQSCLRIRRYGRVLRHFRVEPVVLDVVHLEVILSQLERVAQQALYSATVAGLGVRAHPGVDANGGGGGNGVTVVVASTSGDVASGRSVCQELDDPLWRDSPSLQKYSLLPTRLFFL